MYLTGCSINNTPRTRDAMLKAEKFVEFKDFLLSESLKIARNLFKKLKLRTKLKSLNVAVGNFDCKWMNFSVFSIIGYGIRPFADSVADEKTTAKDFELCSKCSSQFFNIVAQFRRLIFCQIQVLDWVE